MNKIKQFFKNIPTNFYFLIIIIIFLLFLINVNLKSNKPQVFHDNYQIQLDSLSKVVFSLKDSFNKREKPVIIINNNITEHRSYRR